MRNRRFIGLGLIVLLAGSTAAMGDVTINMPPPPKHKATANPAATASALPVQTASDIAMLRYVRGRQGPSNTWGGYARYGWRPHYWPIFDYGYGCRPFGLHSHGSSLFTFGHWSIKINH